MGVWVTGACDKNNLPEKKKWILAGGFSKDCRPNKMIMLSRWYPDLKVKVWVSEAEATREILKAAWIFQWGIHVTAYMGSGSKPVITLVTRDNALRWVSTDTQTHPWTRIQTDRDMHIIKSKINHPNKRNLKAAENRTHEGRILLK